MDQQPVSNASERVFDRDVLVLGIGNILWADEGFGPRCAERFNELYRPIENVTVMDGGTLGNYLSNEVTQSRRIILFDCCDFKAEAGTMKVLRDDDLALWSSTKISPHQQGFNDLLVMAQMLDKAPEAITVIGVQPDVLDDYGGSLSPTLQGLVDKAVELAKQELQAWGYTVEPRGPGEVVESLGDKSLLKAVYEAGRPSEAEACRLGDERFMVRPAGVAHDPLAD